MDSIKDGVYELEKILKALNNSIQRLNDKFPLDEIKQLNKIVQDKISISLGCINDLKVTIKDDNKTKVILRKVENKEIKGLSVVIRNLLKFLDDEMIITYKSIMLKNSISLEDENVNLRNIRLKDSTNDLKSFNQLIKEIIFLKEKLLNKLIKIEQFSLRIYNKYSKEIIKENAKMIGNIVVDNKKIFLEVIGEFKASDNYNGRPLNKYIKEKSNYDIEYGFVSIIYKTIIKALQDHPKIIRKDCNIYVRILNNIFDGESGKYDGSRSNSSMIFISLRLQQDLVEAYIENEEYLKNNSDTYMTIVHELTHSYDENNGISDKEKILVYDLIKENIFPETLEIIRIFSRIRAEGLAILAEKGTGLLDTKNTSITLRLNDLNQRESKKMLKGYTEMLCEKGVSYEKFKGLIIDLSNRGLLHSFGIYITLIILIYYLKDYIELFLLNGKSYAPLYEINTKEGNLSDKLVIIKKVGIKELDSLINKEEFEVFIRIKKIDYNKFREFIYKLSLMNAFQFYWVFIKASFDLGIENDVLKPGVFSNIDDKRHKQFNKLIMVSGRLYFQ
ncbi:MAG: hypothetical protein AABW52_05885 [Nanoarchaeota archaeon]